MQNPPLCHVAEPVWEPLADARHSKMQFLCRVDQSKGLLRRILGPQTHVSEQPTRAFAGKNPECLLQKVRAGGEVTVWSTHPPQSVCCLHTALQLLPQQIHHFQCNLYEISHIRLLPYVFGRDPNVV